VEPVQALAAMASRGYRNIGTTVVGAGIFSILYIPVAQEWARRVNGRTQVIDAHNI
jgi:hypothetical protein